MKNLLLLPAILAFPLVASAQDAQPTQIKIGITAGSNISFMRADDSAYDPWVGRTVGFTAELPLSNRFALSSGLHYEQRNYRMDYELSDPFDPVFYTGTVEYYNHFITLPVTAKLFFSAENSVYVLGGGYSSLAIGNRYKLDGEKLKGTGSEPKTISFGAAFGAGYRWKIDTENELNFEIRDYLELTNGIKNSKGYKSNTIALTINYQLSL